MTEGEQSAAPSTSRTGARWAWWAGFAGAVAVALSLTFAAYAERLPSSLEKFDKLVHCSVAGTLAFFLDGALARRSFVVRGLRVSAAAVALLAIIGLEEFLQRFSRVRTPDFRDYAADLVGVVFFTWLSRRVGRG